MSDSDINRYIPLAALFSAMGIIFPMFFHYLGLGSAFLPMFLPVMMGSLLVPTSIAVSIGILTPLVSFLLTGMPPMFPPILPLMLVELTLVSATVSLLFFRWKRSVWFALIVAMAADRLLLFILVYLLAPAFGLPKTIFSLAMVWHGVPGILLIFLVIPFAIRQLRQKYPHYFNPHSI
jgi:hypothetical protein